MASTLQERRRAAVAICESLGLDPGIVGELTISFRNDGSIDVSAKLFPDQNTLDTIGETITEMRFVQEDIDEADNG